jgi:hypothetical protein
MCHARLGGIMAVGEDLNEGEPDICLLWRVGHRLRIRAALYLAQYRFYDVCE